MKLHSCKVRLNGNVNDEVRKIGVTTAEVRVLKEMHGDEAVLEVVMTGRTARSEAEERSRLEQHYGEKVVTKLFGVPVEKIEEDEPATIADEPDDAETEFNNLPVATRTAPGVESLME